MARKKPLRFAFAPNLSRDRTYVPRRIIAGKHVPVIQEYFRWHRSLSIAIKTIESRLPEYARIRRMVTGGYAPLRTMPTDDWNALMDLLPKCECGRPCAPIRAKKMKAGGIAHCSRECTNKDASRRNQRRKYARRLQAQNEAAAFAQAIGQ